MNTMEDLEDIPDVEQVIANIFMDDFADEIKVWLNSKILEDFEENSELWINAKTSHSMEFIAKYEKENKKTNLEDMIPLYLYDYLDVFSKTAASRFPARYPYDHKIELKEGFKEKRHKNYSLSLEEDTLLKTFIDENLAKGYIQPSMSEMALSFFFVGKKDGKKCHLPSFQF